MPEFLAAPKKLGKISVFVATVRKIDGFLQICGLAKLATIVKGVARSLSPPQKSVDS